MDADNAALKPHNAGINLHPGSTDDGWPEPPPVVLADGTWVQLLKDGEALHAAYTAIELAQKLICLEVYIFGDDPTAHAFADLLCRRAAEGVRVFVIYDSVGSLHTDRAIFARLRRCGVRVQEFHPIRPWELRFSWRPFNRDHRKLLVVDDQIAWLGGMNIADEYGGSWISGASRTARDPWRDTGVGLRGPAAARLLQAFIKTWRYLNHGGRIVKCLHVDDGESLDVLATVPCWKNPVRARLKQMLGDARQSVSLTMAYFAPDDELVEALCRAARSGRNVRLMLPAHSDLPLMVAAARSFYTTLLEAGARVYERQHAILHAKTLVIDSSVSVIGSTNLDYRSIEYNCELSVVIRNAAFGRQMELLFDNDVRYAREITLDSWRRRPVSDRIRQWAVSRARYLL